MNTTTTQSDNTQYGHIRKISDRQLRDYCRGRLIAMACEAAEDYPDSHPADVLDNISERVMVTINSDGSYNIHVAEHEALAGIHFCAPEDVPACMYYEHIDLSWRNAFAGADSSITFAEMDYTETDWGRFVDLFLHDLEAAWDEQLAIVTPLTPEMEEII